MEAIAAPLNQARTALLSGDAARAVRHIQALLAEDAPCDQLVEAADFVRVIDPKLSRQLALRALEQQPHHALATHALAEASARLGLTAKALELYREAVARDGRLAELGRFRDDPDDASHAQPWIGRFEPVVCPACRSEDARPLWAGNISALHRCHGVLDPVRLWVRCADCGLARDAAPPPVPVLQTWNHLEHQEALDPPNATTLATRIRIHDRVIERIRDEGYGTRWIARGDTAPRLLDVGARWGTFLAAADWRGFRATGLATHRPGARWAQQRLGVEVTEGDIPEDLPEGPFDVVTLWGLLDRMTDGAGLLVELARRLEASGLLALSTPTRDHPAHRAQGYDDALWYHPERRVWYDRETLAVALIHAGLQPVRAWHDHREVGSIVVLARKADDEAPG